MLQELFDENIFQYCVTVEDTDGKIKYILVNADNKEKAGNKAIELLEDGDVAFAKNHSIGNRKTIVNMTDEIISEFTNDTMVMIECNGRKATHAVQLTPLDSVLNGTIVAQVDKNFNFSQKIKREAN